MKHAAESGIGNSMTFSPGDCIFINAIDGSPVDIDKEGGTYYMDPESLSWMIFLPHKQPVLFHTLSASKRIPQPKFLYTSFSS